MGQEFFIKSETLESKIRELLPSQGGLGAGIDLSGSTQIVPIVDLTESAEGSNVRQDLQTAFSFNNITEFNARDQTTTITQNTGYFRIKGYISASFATTLAPNGGFTLDDGVTTKTLMEFGQYTWREPFSFVLPFDFIVFLSAGDRLQCVSGSTNCVINGSSRQIADIDGNLVTPT